MTALTGWGRTASTVAEVRHPLDAAEIRAALQHAGPRGVIARGLGRSYGDAAQNAGGVVLDVTGLTGLGQVEDGRVTVGAGVSLDALLKHVVPQGWFVGVSPGTRYVTVGGAIASDIHGKNHHVDGGFCQWVERFTLVTPSGVLELTPDQDVFWATAGGMGLTGVVTEATLRLIPIRSAQMQVTTDRADDLDGAFELLDSDHRYSVAWIDLLSSAGRGVVDRGDHAGDGTLAYDPSPRLAMPPVPSLINAASVKAFNELWYRKAPRHHERREPIPAFFHPLDGVRSWNRVYGPRGFLQYQFVVPLGQEQVVRDAVRRLAAAKAPTFLAVLKKLGPQPGLLSFPMAGWTLAMDVPTTLPGLADLLDDLDAQVAEAGGRVYLTKDSRLRPDVLATMYPGLARWQEIQASLDPDGILRSDLSRRLPLLARREAARGH